MNRDDAKIMGVISFFAILILGVAFLSTKNWDLGAVPVVQASGTASVAYYPSPSPTPAYVIVNRVKVEQVPVTVPAATVTVTIPGSGGGGNSAGCKEAVTAADGIVQAIHSGKDPTVAIDNYETYRSLCQ